MTTELEKSPYEDKLSDTTEMLVQIPMSRYNSLTRLELSFAEIVQAAHDSIFAAYKDRLAYAEGTVIELTELLKEFKTQTEE